MKRLIALGILMLMWLAPVKGKELGQLIPAEVLHVQMKDRMVVLQTDTGAHGKGETLRAAISEMSETAPGILLLETVQFCLLTENGEELIPELQKELRPSVRVCKANDEIDVEKSAKYLRIHIPSRKMMDANIIKMDEILYEEGGTYNLR